MAHAPDLPAQVYGALKSLLMYSSKHTRTQGAIEELTTWLHRRLAERPILHLSSVRGTLLLDGVPTQDTPSATALQKEMALRRISGIILERGIAVREVQELLELLAYRPDGLADLGGAGIHFSNRRCAHIQVRQEDAPAAPALELDFTPLAKAVPAPQEIPPAPAVVMPPPRVFQPEETTEGLELRVAHLVRERLMYMNRDEAESLFLEILDNALLEILYQGVEIILGALKSPRPGDLEQGWVLAEALTGLTGGPELPSGISPLLASGLIGSFPHLGEAPRSQACLDTVAAFLAGAWLREDPAPLQAFLVRMNAEATTGGRELRRRVLGSRAFVTGPLLTVFLEGRNALGPALSLFRAGGEEVGYSLAGLLGEEPSRQRRNRILELLKGMGELAFPALRQCLAAGPWYLTRNALNLLGDLGDTKAYAGAVSCLEHADLRVRRAALRAVWRLGGLRAEHLLLDHLQRSDSETQVEILNGLGQIRAVNAIPAIGALASQAPEPLRIKALETLGQIGHATAIPTLGEYLKRHGRIFKSAESPEVRLAAAGALVAIGTPDAVETLAAAVAEAPKNGDQSALRKILEARSWS